MAGRHLPFIGIPCCLRSINERPFHTVSDRYPNAIIDAAGFLPILIPSIGPKERLRAGQTICTAAQPT